MRQARGRALLGACLILSVCAAARAEDATEDFRRGLAADLGSNGRPDPALAYRYYERAAAMGNADAELNLGVMNDSGVGTLADATQAALWYARAASHGLGRAAFDLGQLYEAGDGVPQNRALAAAWFAQAADEGIAAASYRAQRLLASPEAGALTAPVLVAPAAGTRLSGENVELVWQSASSVPGVRYWVQVAQGGDGEDRTIVYRDTAVSSMLVALPASDGDYAWRVFAAGPDHYQASGWSSFSVRHGAICCLASLSDR